MEEYELTPVANVAFNGIVADEINRLNRELKEKERELEKWRSIADSLAKRLLEIEDFKSKEYEYYKKVISEY